MVTKSITVRKTTNENINGKGCERKKGIDSSSKEKKQKEKKEVPVNDDVSVTDKEVCIDIDGKELSLEEAKKKVGTYLQEKMVDVTSTSESMTHLRKLISILASDILVTANCR